MITLNTPVTESRSIVGYTINEYSEAPQDKRIRASIRVHFSDGTSEVRDENLWHGEDTPAVVVDGVTITPAVIKTNKYADAGQWTDTTAKARIVAILTGK